MEGLRSVKEGGSSGGKNVFSLVPLPPLLLRRLVLLGLAAAACELAVPVASARSVVAVEGDMPSMRGLPETAEGALDDVRVGVGEELPGGGGWEAWGGIPGLPGRIWSLLSTLRIKARCPATVREYGR